MDSFDHRRIAELESENVALRNQLAERNHSLEAISGSQQLLRALLDNSTAMISAKRLDGHYLLANRQFQHLHHVGPEEIASKTDGDFLPAEQAARARRAELRVAASGQATECEEELTVDGVPHTFLAIKIPIRDITGAVNAIGCIAADITARKTAELALRDSETRTRSILDTALDAVIAIDGAGVITGWNPQAEQTFGWRRDEAIGHTLSELVVPPRFRKDYVEGLRHYLATGESPVLGRRLESIGLDRHGREFPVEVAITPITSGRKTTFSAFIRDITERKTSDSRLQAQLARLDLYSRMTRAISERQDLPSIFHVVLDSLEQKLPLEFGCICLSEAGVDDLVIARIGPRSSSIARKLELEEHKRIEIDLEDLRCCVDGKLVYEPDLLAATSGFSFARQLAGVGLRSLVLAPLRAQGSAFGVLVAARRGPDAFSSGDCEFLRQLCEHVALAAHQAQLYSDLHHAYDDLRETRQAILEHERLRALGQMASGIAHDISNALSPAALYAESLLEKEHHVSERGRGYLQTIVRAIGDVAVTVAQMREFYREREPQLTMLPVHLDRLVQEAVELTRARWGDMPQRRGAVIEIRSELAPAPPPVLGQESEIREALINLIFNAVDAMPEGGALTLRSGVQQASASSPVRVYVEVADTGIGMDTDTRRRCLEPFFTTKGERGTGLGLAMVYGIAQRHDADIEIDSAPGKGTRVRLVFPPLTTAVATAPIATAAPMPSPLRLLLIDDDPLLIDALRNTLETDGHSVTGAEGGQQGIDMFAAALQRGEPFAGVITDLGMPYVDGRKVAAAIKALSPKTPVILLTGWGQRLSIENTPPIDVDRVLDKPPKLHELRESLRQCCASNASAARES